MPIYEFVCTGCGSMAELRATLAEKDAGLAPRCGACGAGDLRRAFSTVAVRRSGGAPAPTGGGGGCCGGACGCGAG